MVVVALAWQMAVAWHSDSINKRGCMMIKDGCWMDALRARQRLEVKDGGQGKKGREGERKGKGKAAVSFVRTRHPRRRRERRMARQDLARKCF